MCPTIAIMMADPIGAMYLSSGRNSQTWQGPYKARSTWHMPLLQWGIFGHEN
jgi:hypothetical protein